jgi:alpha-glucosidase (family GH31 glycosyl hydrolase)
VQLGTFQPIDRLHSNHSDRLPWQYGTDAKNSAEKFLNLRENLVPYTYTLAQQASVTGIPVVRPLYLQYPDSQDAYAQSGAEYLYGPDVLVAPVTTPGSSATTSVWFPPGSSWTDYFTGKTYAGGTTQSVTTDLGTMPVFLRSGGIVTTRTANVANDVQNPLTRATVTVAAGADGQTSLYEDNGTDASRSSSTPIQYSDSRHEVRIGPAVGTFTGQVTQRQWTVAVTNATAPTSVTVNGRSVSTWTWDSARRTVTVTTPAQSTGQPLMVAYR